VGAAVLADAGSHEGPVVNSPSPKKGWIVSTLFLEILIFKEASLGDAVTS